MYHIALLHKQFFCFRTYCLDDGFGEKILLVEAFYAFIQIDRSCGGQLQSSQSSGRSPNSQGKPGILYAPNWRFSKIARRNYDDKMPGITVDDCRHEALVMTGGESWSWSLIEQVLAVRSAGATTWSLS